jgi:hypothetical protein
MPMKSKAQNAAMHAAAAGHSTLGIPARVGREFVAESHGKSLKGLPEHKRPRQYGLKKEGKRAG